MKSSDESLTTGSPGDSESDHLNIPKQITEQFSSQSVTIGKLIRRGEYGAVFEGQFGQRFKADEFFNSVKANVHKKGEPKLGKKFAVKFVDIGSREKLGVIGVTNGIKNEVEVLQRISCSGIVDFLFAIQMSKPDLWFLFFELADNNLQVFLHQKKQDKQKLNFRLTKHWIRTLGQTLQYLHEQGISHNRLRPSNVLIFVRNAQTQQIDVKLGDFVSAFSRNNKELEKYTPKEREWMLLDRSLEDLCDFWILSTDLLYDTSFSSTTENNAAFTAIDQLIHSDGTTVDQFRAFLRTQVFSQ